MNLTIFGANGRVGKRVVRRALDQGHHVHAFVHSHDPFEPHPALQVSAGDIADPAAVHNAIEQTETVISTLGTFRRGTGPILATAMQTITQAMNHHHSSRLVVLTGAGVLYPGLRRRTRTRLNRAILTSMDRTAVADVDQAVAALAATDLDWTAVCAPTITTDGPDAYVLTDRMPSLLAQVAGPAVAASLIDLADTATPHQHVVGIQRAPRQSI